MQTPNGFSEKICLMEGLSGKTLFEGLAHSAEDIAVFVSDLETGKSIWSDNAVRYFEFPEDYGDRLNEVWSARVHPDDLGEYCKEITDIFEGRKLKHEYQYRVLKPDGKYAWVECKGYVKVDPESHKRFFIGYVLRLDKTGIYDPVTGCLTLNEFYMHSFSSLHTFVLVGIDSFRKVINRIGFSESNNILRILGDVLRKSNDGRPVYRMTGDEFLAVLPSYSQEELEYLHMRILKEFDTEVEKYHRGLRVQFSAAATYYDAETDSKENVIRRLEHTLEYAKQNGSGSFYMYSEIIANLHERAGKLQEALTNGIKNNFEGFRLVYQPIIRNVDHTLDGAEALLRFYDRELGMISPAEFIPVLEASGEIIPVGRWVVEESIRQKAEWEKVCPGLLMGFNTSLMQYNDDQLVDTVLKCAEKYHVPTNELVVELTESQKMTDARQLSARLQKLVDQKMHVILDDFGMEASTFTLVQELPVTGVKVDHSFVRTLVGSGSERKDRANLAIVSSIDHMAKELGLRCIVEGVENKEIDERLFKMGIEFTQGYYYSRPVSAEEFEDRWLQEDSRFVFQ